MWRYRDLDRINYSLKKMILLYRSDIENISTTEIGNLVVIPHGSKGKVNKNNIVIGILNKDIQWELGSVRLVLMICLDKENILDYENLFSVIYKRVDSIAKVISICESKSFNKFIAMFKQ